MTQDASHAMDNAEKKILFVPSLLSLYDAVSVEYTKETSTDQKIQLKGYMNKINK